MNTSLKSLVSTHLPANKSHQNPARLQSCLLGAITLLCVAQPSIANEKPFGERSIFSDGAINERIAPVGALCLEGDDACGKTEAVEMTVAAKAKLTPEEIYNSKCLACHNSGMMGAPKPGTDFWPARQDEIGLDQIVSHAINGYNNMPPKGMCMDCSDADIRATVEYMIGFGK